MTNHLIHEKSPYLQQHAHNPVEWYPWKEEALTKARAENKPILLSIGYASCHWCHVMAHESFEDKETAKMMNQLFINIKVDREERPDLDKIYQSAHQLLTQQSGGWPLTIFLSPHDLTPFISGTYFPKESRYHLPAFKEVLTKVAEIYHDRFDDINKQNQSLQHILQFQPEPSNQTLNDGPIKLAILDLESSYDKKYGGFNHAPKFPQPTRLQFLLQHHPQLTFHTLTMMAFGGIYDHLAGGFFRYSVDEQWMIPHFEKMLYDNGQLLFLYSLAFLYSNNSHYLEIANQTADWIIHHMQSDNGGYYGSLDADSEGHEGKFYVWDKDEIKSLLNPDEYKIFTECFGLNNPPNFENKWHLYVSDPDSLENKNNKKIIDAAKIKLLNARKKRIAPPLDQKILTSWNALTIKGMLIAGDVASNDSSIDSAKKALAFLHKQMFQHNRLMACYFDHQAYQAAYLDDYAFTIDALITSLQIEWETKHLEFAINLANSMLEHFYDPLGGFFFTADDQKKILYRPKTMIDEATPPGNGVAVQVLLILGHLLGETKFLNAAEQTLKAAWLALTHYPSAHCSMLIGLAMYLKPPTIVIIRGSKKEIREWRDACKKLDAILFAIPNDEKILPGILQTQTGRDQTVAYVCKGTQCLPVIDNVEELVKLIQKRSTF